MVVTCYEIHVVDLSCYISDLKIFGSSDRGNLQSVVLIVA